MLKDYRLIEEKHPLLEPLVGGVSRCYLVINSNLIIIVIIIYSANNALIEDNISRSNNLMLTRNLYSVDILSFIADKLANLTTASKLITSLNIIIKNKGSASIYLKMSDVRYIRRTTKELVNKVK